MPMTDSEIRKSVHSKMLRRHHGAPETLVIDELGLRHGSCRADIAVINGRLVGYEIKSDRDSLVRLKKQVSLYDAIFDRITIIVGPRHQSEVSRRVPRHWGVVLATVGRRGAVRFQTKRRSRLNRRVDLLSVAQLLWRIEAMQMVRAMNPSFEVLRFSRTQLYRYLVTNVSPETLRREVRSRLRKRPNWRDRKQPFLYDGSFRLGATSSNFQAEHDAERISECSRLRRKTSRQETSQT